MSLQLPIFLRRRLRLHEARRALFAGEPEAALAHLDDPALALSEEAERVREKALDVLCRAAAQHVAQGRAEEGERLLARVEQVDPERARAWRRRLGQERDSADLRARGALRQEAESGILTALEGLLARLREQRRERASLTAAPSSELRRATAAGRPVADPARALRLHLAVDDAGEYLVAVGEELVLGHSRAGRADLPLLADLEPRHAVLRPVESFHGGSGWELAPLEGQGVRVAGRPVGPDGARLADGDRVELSPHLAFDFRAPDPTSASARLELLHGAECAGAARVLLLRPGPAGAVRMGARRDRHVVVRGRTHELRLELDGAELELSAVGGLLPRGAGEPLERVRLPLPLPARVDLVLAASEPGRPPFALSLRPFEEPPAGGGTLP